MMGKKVLAAKSGRAACSCTAAGGGGCSVGVFNAEKQSSREAKSFLTGLTGFTGLREASVKPAKTKPSGVAWIGDIPEGWEVGKLGSLYTQRNEKVSDKVYPPLSVTMKGIVPQLATAAKSDDGDNRKLVRKGDFAINSRSDRRGSCGISEFDGSVSLINTILTPRGKMNPVYYNWLFHTEAFADEFYKWGHGIVDDLWTTRWSEMKRIAIVVPPLPVQRAIAVYLDEKCGAIDEAIVEAKKGIEEYKAWKKSLIFEVVTGKRRVGFFNAESKCARDEMHLRRSRQVTRGHRPSPVGGASGCVVGLPERSEPEGLQGAARRRVAEKMKPSGIPWIGDVPEGWKIVKGKYLLSASSGDALRNELLVDIGNYPVFGGGEVIGYTNDWNCEAKTILIGRVGARCGCVTLLKDKAWATDNALIISTEEESRYLSYLLVGADLNQYNSSNAQPLITAGRIRNLSFPYVDDKSEQRAIADYLDEKCAAIDAMIAEKEALIADLEAYKKSLIYEAVTGKREVSNINERKKRGSF